MKLSDAAHTSRDWHVHDLARGFELLDVWALPTPGGPGDFPRLVELLTTLDPARDTPRATRLLFAIRKQVGALLHWDDPDGETLASGFTPMFARNDEWAAEIVNRTVHGILHLGWVPDGRGAYRGQLAVLVRPNGLLGRAYLAAIGPFRHLVVYPQLLGSLERAWGGDHAG
jgi:hypothetical protein